MCKNTLEFTEKMHAFLAAAYYETLTEQYKERGAQAFVLAVRTYGEQRGRRMAMRAVRDGKTLDFAAYRAYGEIAASKTATSEGSSNLSTIASHSPDLVEDITRCPWAMQFTEKNMLDAGRLYCREIDASIVRGFNPALRFELTQTLYDSPCCRQISRDVQFPDGFTGAVQAKDKKYLKGYDYHCADLYYTCARVVRNIFGQEGQQTADKVLECFADTYGAEAAKILKSYQGYDFASIGDLSS